MFTVGIRVGRSGELIGNYKMIDLDLSSYEVGIRFDKWSSLPDPLDTSGDSSQNACIGRQYSDHSVSAMYSLGFRHAAVLIAGHVNEHRSYQDTLVYPFLFNWRHYFELILKEVIHYGRILHDEQGDPNKIGHGLGRCWRIARPLVVKTWPDGGAAELDNCGGFINKLNDMDPSGQAFRYSHDSNSKDRHLSEMSLLNFESFNVVAISVGDFLSGCVGGMEEYIDYMNEQQLDSGGY